MPNTHTHLAAVSTLLVPTALPSRIPWLAGPDVQAAFLLGAISPDVRVVSGHAREDTHFIPIPPPEGVLAQDVMLVTWQELQPGSVRESAHAAFVAGYIAHLIMDQTWLDTVVMPGLFIDGIEWGTGHPNWRLYGILMTYLEYRGAQRLPPHITPLLAQASPNRWLPFVEDRHLIQWRDHVVQTIQTDGARRTSQIFARSCGLSAEALEAIVLSEERMTVEAYSVVSPLRLQQFEAETDRRTQNAVIEYLSQI